MGRSSGQISTLKELLDLERDVGAAYQLAIDNIVDEPMTRDTIMSFHTDQLRHVRELEQVLSALGGSPGPGPRSLLVMKEPDAFARAGGTTEVLELLKGNAELVVRRYQDALHQDLPEDVADVVRGACNDQLRHRAWIAARVEAFTNTSRPFAARRRDSRTSVH